ncbi:SCO family protein [Patiriisocius sp. Uisw_047]|jgi:protein SCO1/2|uniref:SCO family protein n=1 Tax=Patiriisocius sp. Uisw_047 TaxID=3230969 RepID=UPI0039EC2A87
MQSFFLKYKMLWIVLTVLSVVIIYSIYSILKPEEARLPVYQPKGTGLNIELVDSTVQHIKKNHTIADFKLTNQNGKAITQDDYQNKIYVADFFFTTCQTICPIMTDHMVQIQDKIKNNPDVLLLSHTVMPEVDSVAQLKKYALEKGVDALKWNLVTGSKKEIYDLARKSYMAAKENPGNPYGLIHTENFLLIDKKKRVRGFYDGTLQEDIDRLLGDIEKLQREDVKH